MNSRNRNTIYSVLGGVGIGIGVAVAAQQLWDAYSSSSTSKKNKNNANIQKQNISDAQLKKIFLNAFDSIKQQLINDIPKDLPSVQSKYIEELLPYTVLDGKMNRGLAAVKTYLILQDYRVTDEELHRSCVLGWCIEMLQAYFLIEDDIMDYSEMRRGKPCWYKRKDVGLKAINDGMIIQSMIFRLIDLHFGGTEAHPHLVHAFHETTYLTELGQMLDLLTEQPQPHIDWNVFTLDRHKNIIVYKTAFYSFYLPVVLGLIQGGIYPDENPEIYSLTRKICVEMGTYFQIQDDYLDCFGTVEQLGKVGRDIEDAKCSWVVNQALLHCTPEQRQILEDNYGVDDPEAVARVKKVFEETNVPDLYAAYEREVVASIKNKIEKVESLPKDIFYSFLKKIEGRSK